MFKNLLKITFRSFWKNKTYSFVNIIGLAIGTLCCLYILLYVRQQYSYDKYHAQAENIYRVNSALVLPGDKHTTMGTASPPIAPALKNDFSEVIQFTRVVGTIGIDEHLLRYKEKSFNEKEAVFVDSTFFDIFSYHFVNGSPKDALNQPYSLVILKSVADKLFDPGEDPIGKVVVIDNGYGKNDFKITGVVDESLGKSHLHANLFMTMNSGGLGDYVRTSDSWAGNNFTSSYVKLNPMANPRLLEKKLPDFLQRHGADQFKSRGVQKVLSLQSINSIHTTPGNTASMSKAVSPSFLNILLLIAFLIQLIACINFMNLSTARAVKRAKEVGVRKVIGAQRKDLIRQFLGESFLLSFLAVTIAIPLLWVALPFLNNVTDADIQLTIFSDYRLWLILGGLILVTGFAAGSYPALYLSAFKAIRVLKGNFTNQISATGIRRSLVVFQFVLSIILIAGIIIIYQQLKYINQKDLGFEKEQRLIFTFHTNDAQAQMKPIVNDLRNLSEIKAVSKSNNYLSKFVFNDMPIYLAGGDIATSSRDVQFMSTDENFVASNGIHLISGRDLRSHDSGYVLINETLTKQLGLDPKRAPGTKLYSHPGDDGKPAEFEIAGVMKDFNYNSLHEDIKAFMLIYSPDADMTTGSSLQTLVVAANTADYKSLLGKIEKIWSKYLSDVPFEYRFLDEEVKKQYETEITLAKIINSFALMAILISCLGLFGLAAFSAEQRRKEIGIRKVLGATTSGLTALLSKDFVKLVLIALVIAIPVSWWAMNKWLEGFAYRTHISWWMFAVAGFLALFIALLTVSFQAIKAAIANPVKSLRTE